MGARVAYGDPRSRPRLRARQEALLLYPVMEKREHAAGGGFHPPSKDVIVALVVVEPMSARSGNPQVLHSIVGNRQLEDEPGVDAQADDPAATAT